MPGLTIDLLPIWTFIIGLGVFFYVLLDGFDLGVGILFGFAPDERARALVMNSIAPIWDGNETWLILGGVALLAVFPLAYAIIIPAVYFPLLIMLLALTFRGVAFEFRFKNPRIRRFWERGFCVGSGVAAFAQGMVLGTFIQGYEVTDRAYSGSELDWLRPFPIVIGIAVMFGYALLGAGWLILKTEGGLQVWARRLGRRSFWGVLAAIAIVSAWTPLMHPEIARRWFSTPNIFFLWPVPLFTVLVAWIEWRALSGEFTDPVPFIGAFGLFVVSYTGVIVSLWPMIVPFHYTIWDAASSSSTQAFLLLGTLFFLPIIIMYSAWSYWVFRGKVRGDIGYHS
ncbi:MAG TPA: cytochrome d ubiquinol oxidase subunit II [Acetobacteraceae bacterium]|nr:cytochrome d ubiquinol oxidase subunit II [Acetobacteraceae bacterium]